MNNFIITGSQRSGTTLLKLILNAHPHIKVLDEDEVGFHGENIQNYKSDETVFGFKLPMVTNDIDFLKTTKLKLVHIIRDPRDVIKSMLELPIPYNLHYDNNQKYKKPKFNQSGILRYLNYKLRRTIQIPWAIHPSGLDPEANLLLKNQVQLSDSENAFIHMHPLNRNVRDAISICSKVWNNKNEVIEQYRQNQLKHIVISYEELLKNPSASVKKILDFLCLEEVNDLLKYYKNNKGISIGNTKNDEPLKQNNIKKWEGFYDLKELSIISRNCFQTATKFNYNLKTE